VEQGRTSEEHEDKSAQLGTLDFTQESTQDSQSLRPAKRRRITNGPNPTSEEQPPAKKPRRVGTAESARFQSASEESIDQQGKPNEIKDSYEEDQRLTSLGGGKATVEIPIHDSFDRNAYSRVLTSSQLSQSQVHSSPQLQTPKLRHKYSSTIWDEDIEGVIPDSQEQPGSSSYRPSETLISKTTTSSRLGTEVNTGTDLEEVGVSNTETTSSHGDSKASGTLASEFAEPLNGFSQASYTYKSPYSSSVQAGPIRAPSSNPDQIYSSAQEPREGEAEYIEQSNGLLDKNVLSPHSSAELGVEESDIRTSSDSLLFQTSSEERAPVVSQEQPSQTSLAVVQESSSLDFQTQLPLLRDETENIIPSPYASLVER
jgi:hypothetical protein